MNLFDQLVFQALKNTEHLGILQVVVEKELLHHDIIREMGTAGFLNHLTFIGGTCLRACYGSNRLSEDLDFTGGSGFSRGLLSELGHVLVDRLETKYGLHVSVNEPVQDFGNVDTWKLKVITRPEKKMLPQQRINIDVCAVPSYDRRPMMLRNHYGVELGTTGLILQAQSREEILADKLVAFALRSNRLKNRDLWDIAWLKQQGIKLPGHLVSLKIRDRQCSKTEFLGLLKDRNKHLQTSRSVHQEFVGEMKRFLPANIVMQTVEKSDFWDYLKTILSIECELVVRSFEDKNGETLTFQM